MSDCIPAGGIEKERLLRLAALAESRSTHPIAQSILTAAGVVEEEAVTDARETADTALRSPLLRAVLWPVSRNIWRKTAWMCRTLQQEAPPPSM